MLTYLLPKSLPKKITVLTYRFTLFKVTFLLLLSSYLFAQDPLSPLARGIQKYRQGDLEGAVIDFELAFTQKKEDEKAKQYFLNCLTGIVYRYIDGKDYAKALPYAERAYELAPKDEEIKKLYETVKKETAVPAVPPQPKEVKPTKEKEVITPKGETKKETTPPPEKKEAITSKEIKPVEEKKREVKPPPEEKVEVGKEVIPKKEKELKPLDTPGRLRIFQVLQKYRQGNFKETFLEFEDLYAEYNDPHLKRTFVECLVGAATKLGEEKNYRDAFTYAKRAYELNPHDTAAERVYKNLLKQVEMGEKNKK